MVRIHSPRPLFFSNSCKFSRLGHSVSPEKAGGSNRFGSPAAAKMLGNRDQVPTVRRRFS